MKQILLFGAVSTVLVIIWFGNGKTLASGEEGIPFYNPQVTFNIYHSTWYETGTGYAMPIVSSRAPLMWLGMEIQNFTNNQTTQIIVFWILLTSTLIWMWLLTKELFGNQDVQIIASLFYLFNLYSLSQTWGRFLYTGIFAWAYLPLFLFIWIKWIKKSSFIWLITIPLSSLAFSYAYGHPSYIISLWTPVLTFFIWEIFHRRQKVLRNSVLGMTVWLLINLWWIYPEVKLATTAFSSISNWEANFNSLQGVSQYFPTDKILLLQQNYLFGKGSLWFSWYSQPGVELISILVLLIMIVGLISSRKLPPWKWLVSLAFLGWFVSKGSNPPFGFGLFNWLFSNFPFMAILRNPYEKFGIVWLLSYSIFFALGLLKVKNRLARIGILFLTFGVLVWPMWNGDIYKNARIRIPDYYKQSNDYLNQDKSFGRILMLPMIPGDGVRYFWGYQGIEPGEFLFDRASISKILRTEYFDDKYLNLYKKFINGKSYDRDLEEISTKYLVLHHDLDTEFSGASYSAQIIEILSKNPKIRFLKKFGDLSIYEFKSNNLSLFETNGPEIEYEKVSPTKYAIKVKDIQRPYTLIFKETFDRNWIVRINGKVQQNHFLIYDYANAWNIDHNGSYNIQVIYKVWPWD